MRPIDTLSPSTIQASSTTAVDSSKSGSPTSSPLEHSTRWTIQSTTFWVNVVGPTKKVKKTLTFSTRKKKVTLVFLVINAIFRFFKKKRKKSLPIVHFPAGFALQNCKNYIKRNENSSVFTRSGIGAKICSCGWGCKLSLKT